MFDYLGGKFKRKFDQVNRMSIPPEFRELLGSKVYLISSLYDDPCIWVFSEEKFAIFAEGIDDTFEGEEQAQIQRLLADRLSIAGVDRSGRITVPEEQREWAELGEEVFVVGMGNRVELWSEENWQSHKTFSGDKSRITRSPKGARRV